MWSTDNLRGFVIERLTAAAEDIFVVFQRTIVEYEAEIDRQRTLLDIVWQPHVNVHRIEVPQQHECKKEEVVVDQQLCDQERNFRLHQEEPEPPQMKEEQEELCISLEREELTVKQETETLMLTPTHEDSDHSEPEQQNEQNVLSHISHVAVNQDPHGSKHDDSESSGSESTSKDILQKRRTEKTEASGIVCIPHQSQKLFKCDICGEEVNSKLELQTHQCAHESAFTCETCKCTFRDRSDLKTHMRTHPCEKPYSCDTCGAKFTLKTNLNKHKRIHTGEKPFSCETCGAKFIQKSDMIIHKRIHTGEKPYSCKECDWSFKYSNALKIHVRRAHTGERPYICKTCGKTFFSSSHRSQHMKSHANK